MVTVEDYHRVFEAERVQTYPVIDAFEAQCGYALDRERLESAAEVLACPVKTSPPNWQHGRVLYALTRKYLRDQSPGHCQIFDIGTAKGFSALCLQWALIDHGASGHVTSVDILNPDARVERKTIAEVDGLITLADTLTTWPDAKAISFVGTTGIDWLIAHPVRIHVAFIDGSHHDDVVGMEGHLLADRQLPGDLVIFDDVHRPGILHVVQSLEPRYRFEMVKVLPTRHYAIGTRR